MSSLLGYISGKTPLNLGVVATASQAMAQDFKQGNIGPDGTIFGIVFSVPDDIVDRTISSITDRSMHWALPTYIRTYKIGDRSFVDFRTAIEPHQTHEQLFKTVGLDTNSSTLVIVNQTYRSLQDPDEDLGIVWIRDTTTQPMPIHEGGHLIAIRISDYNPATFKTIDQLSRLDGELLYSPTAIPILIAKLVKGHQISGYDLDRVTREGLIGRSRSLTVTSDERSDAYLIGLSTDRIYNSPYGLHFAHCNDWMFICSPQAAIDVIHSRFTEKHTSGVLNNGEKRAFHPSRNLERF